LTSAAEFAVSRTDSGIAFWIHVTPRSRRPSLGGLHGDALRVAVREPPVSGAANAACSRALARALNVRRAEVELDPASSGRRKRVRVRGDAEVLTQRIRGLAGAGNSQ
jgi:hypothetical protein